MNAMMALHGPQDSRALFGKTCTTRGAWSVDMAAFFPSAAGNSNEFIRAPEK
jgi:hypothetical protein